MIQLIKSIHERDDSKSLRQLDDFIYQGICNENGILDLKRKYYTVRVQEIDAYKFYDSSSYYCNINQYVGMPRITLLHSIVTGKCGIYLQNFDETITLRKGNYIHLFFDYLYASGYKGNFYYRIQKSIYCKEYYYFYNYIKINEESLIQKPKLYYMTICNMSNLCYSLTR